MFIVPKAKVIAQTINDDDDDKECYLDQARQLLKEHLEQYTAFKRFFSRTTKPSYLFQLNQIAQDPSIDEVNALLLRLQAISNPNTELLTLIERFKNQFHLHTATSTITQNDYQAIAAFLTQFNTLKTETRSNGILSSGKLSPEAWLNLQLASIAQTLKISLQELLASNAQAPHLFSNAMTLIESQLKLAWDARLHYADTHHESSVQPYSPLFCANETMDPTTGEIRVYKTPSKAGKFESNLVDALAATQLFLNDEQKSTVAALITKIQGYSPTPILIKTLGATSFNQ